MDFQRYEGQTFVRLQKAHSRDKLTLQWLYYNEERDSYRMAHTTYTKGQQYDKWYFNINRTWSPSEADDRLYQLLEHYVESWYGVIREDATF